jgi:hypothetical protein
MPPFEEKIRHQIRDEMAIKPVITMTALKERIEKASANMFARWQKQPRPNNGIYWVAQLVSSTSVNGAPRQKHLAYLGGIAEDMKGDAEARHRFWTKANAALKKLKPKDRQKIVQSLAARVPPPTKQQLQRQQLQVLQHSLQAAQKRVQAIKLEMRAVRSGA